MQFPTSTFGEFVRLPFGNAYTTFGPAADAPQSTCAFEGNQRLLAPDTDAPQSTCVFALGTPKPARSQHVDPLDFCTCFEQCLYYLSVVSVGLWFVWISWMPFLEWLAPSSVSGDWIDGPTTISDTFRRYSTVSTVYMTGPLSILFVFRLYRTFRSPLTTWQKKNVTSCLLLVQYSLYVIIRYDHIYGSVHGIFVLLTVLLLMYYHLCVHYTSIAHPDTPPLATVKRLKKQYAAVSLLFLFLFAALLIASDLVEGSLWYFFACVCEVVGIALLGYLDVIDIRNIRHE